MLVMAQYDHDAHQICCGRPPELFFWHKQCTRRPSLGCSRVPWCWTISELTRLLWVWCQCTCAYVCHALMLCCIGVFKYMLYSGYRDLWYVPWTAVFDWTDCLYFGFRPTLLGSVSSIITIIVILHFLWTSYHFTKDFVWIVSLFWSIVSHKFDKKSLKIRKCSFECSFVSWYRVKGRYFGAKFRLFCQDRDLTLQ